MNCDSCNRLQATYHVTQIKADKKTEGHYCMACAVLRRLSGVEEVAIMRDEFEAFVGRESKKALAEMSLATALQFAFNSGWVARNRRKDT